MNKKLAILITAMLIVLMLSGCVKTEDLKSYDVLSTRYYTETLESGLFTVKRDTDEYVEVIWSDGKENHKCDILLCFVEIGDKTEVKSVDGSDSVYDLYMTLEDYNAMIEANTKGVSESE